MILEKTKKTQVTLRAHD